MDFEKAPVQKKKEPRKIPKRLVLVIIVLLCAGGLGFYGYQERELVYQYYQKYAQREEKLQSIRFDSVLVNLADTDSTRYLKASVVLEYRGKKLGEEIKTKSYRIKDIMIEVMRNQTVDSLSISGTSILKRDFIKAINQELTEGKISGLYFEDFIIQ